MKVLMINGSPRANGNTAIALGEMEKVFEAEGIETEVLQIGKMDIRGCIACASSVVAARRGGLSATFDELNKYFTISGMPVAAGQYWNGIHGSAAGEAQGDGEGLQMMRTLARNMAFLMKSIALGKEKYGLPETEEPQKTNFIR